MTQWTADQRAEAVAALRGGEPLADVHRRTGVPKPTLSRWATEAGVQPPGAEQAERAANATRLAWARRRATLADEIGAGLGRLLDKCLDADNGTDARGYAIAFGTLIDKAQLVSGGVTSRHEQMTADRARERIAEMADELAARRAKGGAAQGG